MTTAFLFLRSAYAVFSALYYKVLVIREITPRAGGGAVMTRGQSWLLVLLGCVSCGAAQAVASFVAPPIVHRARENPWIWGLAALPVYLPTCLQTATA